ncbi:MAG: hypothetical protein RSA02_04555 [Bacteroidales bacterium]
MSNKTIYTALTIGAAIAVLLTILLVRKIKKDKSITDKIKIEDTNLSLEKSEYSILANQLFTSMNGVGTDFKSIERVLIKIKNNDDWNDLIKAFGTREVKRWPYKFTGTLYDWFQDELTTKEINTLNTLIAPLGVSI